MSQYPLEEKKEDSVKLLKDAIETKIDELTEINRRLKKKLFDLNTVLELSRQLNSVLYLDSILEDTLLFCLEHLSVKGAFISVQRYLDDKSLSLSKSKGIEIQHDLGFSLDSTLADYLKDKNKPLFFEELVTRFKSVQGKRRPHVGPHPELIAPMVIRGNLKGILLLSDKIKGTPYSEDELEFISILTGQVAIAVENCLLYQYERDMNLELKSLKQKLSQTDNLATMGQLSVAVAHEINNPLGIIKNYLALLKQALKKSDKSGTYLEAIEGEVDRVARITRHLLDCYHPKSEVKSLINIDFLMDDALTFVKEEFSKNKISIKKNFPKNLPKIKAFPQELRQVFLNLLINCKESMTQGGEIELSTNVKKDKLDIEFKDTGKGVEEKELSRIFDSPSTTKDKGAGLGLWISHHLVRRQGGEIKVRNREDRTGTNYILSLPFEA
jgi:signal transduction histidine kinase